MPRSGGAAKTGDQLVQQTADHVAGLEDTGGSDDDSEDEILETSDNGRYQKMNEQVKGKREGGDTFLSL